MERENKLNNLDRKNHWKKRRDEKSAWKELFHLEDYFHAPITRTIEREEETRVPMKKLSFGRLISRTHRKNHRKRRGDESADEETFIWKITFTHPS
ncbi:hypothetical protein JTE90_009001 [Oedothorax gibbosus]|uniref:Uncharacterized protein n=1 Tax=Oedothorax gibbosus TaxID=931172 RepID=A0AAV6VK35_9ARAC|nr:hypothetical protein JTE90_009001 [Oedothorax gibbosus]